METTIESSKFSELEDFELQEVDGGFFFIPVIIGAGVGAGVGAIVLWDLVFPQKAW